MAVVFVGSSSKAVAERRGGRCLLEWGPECVHYSPVGETAKWAIFVSDPDLVF
jgi:hypothetical protein